MIPLHDDNPSRITPWVTWLLIAVCVGVFLLQWSADPDEQVRAVYRFGTIPAVLLHDRLLPAELAPIPAELTLLTALFLHGGWLHLIGNMLYLWIFGNNVEEAMGHGRFLIFYLVCGVLASLAHSLPAPASEVPLVGASGAIAGVLGAYALLYPHARVLVAIPLLVVFFTLRLPALLVIGLWFALQLVSNSADPGAEGGVAYAAHIGGFIAGVALLLPFKRAAVRLFQPPRR